MLLQNHKGPKITLEWLDLWNTFEQQLQLHWKIRPKPMEGLILDSVGQRLGFEKADPTYFLIKLETLGRCLPLEFNY